MSEERKPWEQNIEAGEPDLWYGRFVKYLRLGSKRSVNALYAKEAKAAKNSEKQRNLDAGGDWYDIEKAWNWKERARAYDEWQRKEEDRIIAEEKDKVLRSGFALMHKRIKELDRQARKLIQMTNDEQKIWVPEVRTVIMGEDKSQTIEKLTFNAPLFTTIDKIFDSIAKETGERVKKKDITITEMPASVYQGFNPDEDGTVTDGNEALPNSEPQQNTGNEGQQAV
jgi:hypothetical protein